MGFELNIRTPIKMQEYNERIDLDEIHVNFAIPGIYYIIDKEDKTLESIFINSEIWSSISGVSTKVSKKVSEIAEDITHANKDGYINKIGKIYCNRNRLQNLLGINSRRINKIIDRNDIESIKGVNCNGRYPADYYCVEDIKNHILPRANKAGEIFDEEANKYLSLSGYRSTKIGEIELNKIINENGTEVVTIDLPAKEAENKIRVIKAKSHRGGKETDYYCVEDIEKHILPRANEAGEIFDEEGNKYLNRSGLLKIEVLGILKIKSIIEAHEIRVIIGKSHNGIKETSYYCVEDIEKHILPHANEAGEIFDEEGNKYLPTRKLEESIKSLGRYKIKSIIEAHEIRVIIGKSHNGIKETSYYCVEDIEEHILPCANKAGEISDQEGNKYFNKSRLKKNIKGLGQDSVDKIIKENKNNFIFGTIDLPAKEAENKIRVIIAKDDRGRNKNNYYCCEDVKKIYIEKIKPAVFMKGCAFEQLVGVYLRMLYPNDNIESQHYMSEEDDENGKKHYSDRIDFYIPSENMFVEVKWGKAIFKINKHYERQQSLLKEGQNYMGICMVENNGLPKEFVSLEKHMEGNIREDKHYIFESLLAFINKLAEENDAKTLKTIRNALYSIFKLKDNFEKQIKGLTLLINLSCVVDKKYQEQKINVLCEEHSIEDPPRAFIGNQKLYALMDDEELMMAA